MLALWSYYNYILVQNRVLYKYICLLMDRHETEKQKTKLIFYYYKIIKLQKWKTNASKTSR